MDDELHPCFGLVLCWACCHLKALGGVTPISRWFASIFIWENNAKEIAVGRYEGEGVGQIQRQENSAETQRKTGRGSDRAGCTHTPWPSPSLQQEH